MPHKSTQPAPAATVRGWLRPYCPDGVELNQQAQGQCPFGEHHEHGCDRRRSFKVFDPSTPGGMCWYCYTWGKGDSVFGFFRLYYGLDARDLWSHIRAGAQF